MKDKSVTSTNELSDDAKGLFACMWGAKITSGAELNFQMHKSRPTSRTQAALDELVACGYLWREELPGGEVSYKPLGPRVKQYRRFTKLGNFELTEPV